MIERQIEKIPAIFPALHGEKYSVETGETTRKITY